MSRLQGLLTSFLAVICTTLVLAQQPPRPASPPSNDPELDELLARWERVMADTQTLALDVTCTRNDPIFNKKTILTGYAKFMRQASGEYLAALKLVNQQDPNKYERYVMTGAAIYVFLPEEKLISVYNVPPRQAGQPPDEGPLPFLFGMKADYLKRRYGLSVSKKYKENEWYTYVDVAPKYPKDQADFIEARLAIMKRDTRALGRDMIKEIYLVEPNNTQVTYDVTRLQRNVPGSVDRSEFVQPVLPPGWNWKTNATATRAGPPPQGPPGVVRPQGNQ